MTQYRNRIIIGNQEKYLSYRDEITNPELQDFINKFYLLYNIYGNNFTMKNNTFQKSNQDNRFGAIIEVNKLDIENIRNIVKLLKPEIFGVKYNDSIIYFTKVTNFVENNYSISLSGFAQVSTELSNFAHNCVNKIISKIKIKYQYIGLGGESYYYFNNNKNHFSSGILYTNSSGVYEDNKTSKIYNRDRESKNNLVDYKELKLDITQQSFCMVNISRNGLRELAQEILNNPIFELVYIGCCEKSSNKDITKLQEKFYIVDKYYYKQNCNELFIYHLKRKEIVSLGSSCSIAYQLQKHNYRISSYPFDWIKVNKLENIITCLKNNFEDFIPNIAEQEGKLTNKYPFIEDDIYENNDIMTKIVRNKYNMDFVHDFRENNYMQVIEKYKRRINKFMDNKNKIYVRLEENPKKLKIEEIEKLLEIHGDIKLHIILSNPNKEKLDILKYKNPSIIFIEDNTKFDNWQRNNFDWNNFFRQIG
jgi:hypothetical protein